MSGRKGAPRTEYFDTPANGEFYPVNGDTMASFVLSGPMLQATFKDEANHSDTLTCTVSADKNRMTCKGTLVGDGGRTVNYTDVYDRR